MILFFRHAQSLQKTNEELVGSGQPRDVYTENITVRGLRITIKPYSQTDYRT